MINPDCQKIDNQDLLNYAFSFVKRSETTTASYAGEIKSLKQGISTCDIIFGVQANKISKGEMPYGK